MLFLQPGSKIRAFTLQECLGRGGVSSVWKARHSETGQDYALKILHGSMADEESARQRFIEEGLLQARVSHPHVVSVKGRIEAHPVHALVMEYVDGPTLDEAVRVRPNGLLLSEAKTISTGILSALNAAHRRGIIHRAVKPSNIILARDLYAITPKLTDFGIAKYKFGRSSGAAAAPLDTPHFMSPEQLKGNTDITAQSDIFSFGVTLYFMLTGHYPYDHEDLNVLSTKICAGGHEPASTHRESLTSDIDELIDRCMAVKSVDRPKSCREVMESILAIDWTDPPQEVERRKAITGERDAVPAPVGRILVTNGEREVAASLPWPTLPKSEAPSQRRSAAQTPTQRMEVLESDTGERRRPPPIPLDALGANDPAWIEPEDMPSRVDELTPHPDMVRAFKRTTRAPVVILLILLLVGAAAATRYILGAANGDTEEEAEQEAVEEDSGQLAVQLPQQGGESSDSRNRPIAFGTATNGQQAAVTAGGRQAQATGPMPGGAEGAEEAAPTTAGTEGTAQNGDSIEAAGTTGQSGSEAGEAASAGTGGGDEIPEVLRVATADSDVSSDSSAEADRHEPVAATTEAPTPQAAERARGDEEEDESRSEREERRERDRDRVRDAALSAEPTPMTSSRERSRDDDLGALERARRQRETAPPASSRRQPDVAVEAPPPPPLPPVGNEELTPLQVNTALRTERDAFRECFDPGDDGSVTMRINIRPDGGVGYASPTSRGVNPALSRCLTQVIARITFDSFNGSAMNVRHTFTRAGP